MGACGMTHDRAAKEGEGRLSEQSYCARCNCRRYRNAEGRCEVCALYQAKRATQPPQELVSLPAEWRARPHRVAIPYEIQQLGNVHAIVEAITLAVNRCAEELEAALTRGEVEG